MKKIRFILFLLTVASLLLPGCSGKKETEGKTEQERFRDEKEYLVMANLTESNDGLYGVDWGDEYDPIFFVDKKTAKKTVLCQKVNCKHDSEECPAVEAGLVGCMAYSDGTLYFLVYRNESSHQLELYSMEADGTGKKRLHTFENARIFPNQAGLYKGKVILSVQTSKELEDGSGATTAEPSIVMYDLKTKKETVLLDGRENEGNYTIPCGGSEDGFYLVQIPWSYTGENETAKYLRYDFETGKLSEVYKTEISDVQIIKNDTLYLQIKEKKQLESYHLKTQDKKNIFEWKDDADEVWVREGHVELRKDVEEGDKRTTYCKWYDLEEEKYLFDEYLDLNKTEVRIKTENGYWIWKEGKNYFYHPEDESWQEIEEIK